MASKSDPLNGVKFLKDHELVATWGWMQSTVPAGAPIAKAMIDELAKRGLTAPSNPIDFSKMKVLDCTKPGMLKVMK
jgi:hypothetical protein